MDKIVGNRAVTLFVVMLKTTSSTRCLRDRRFYVHVFQTHGSCAYDFRSRMYLDYTRTCRVFLASRFFTTAVLPQTVYPRSKRAITNSSTLFAGAMRLTDLPIVVLLGAGCVHAQVYNELKTDTVCQL
jgi:hypothetical protein